MKTHEEMNTGVDRQMMDGDLGRQLSEGCRGLCERGVQLGLGQALVVQQPGESGHRGGRYGRFLSGASSRGLWIVLEPLRLQTLIGARGHSA